MPAPAQTPAPNWFEQNDPSKGTPAPAKDWFAQNDPDLPAKPTSDGPSGILTSLGNTARGILDLSASQLKHVTSGNLLEIVQGLSPLSIPIDILKNTAAASAQQMEQGAAKVNAGDPAGWRKLTIGAIPILGPGIETAAEKMTSGRPWEGATDYLQLLAPAAGEIPGLSRAAGAVKSGATTAMEAIKARGGKIAANPKIMREVGTILGGAAGAELLGGQGMLGGGYLGRRLGGYVGKALADRMAPKVPEAPATPAVYDEIAKGMGAKDYATAGPVIQAVIEKVAAMDAARGAAKPAPPVQTAGPQLPVNIPPPEIPVVSTTREPYSLDEALAARAAKEAKAKTAQTAVDPSASLEDLLSQSLDLVKQGKRAAPIIPEPAAPDISAITETVRDLPKETRNEVAKSAYRAAKEGKLPEATAAATYESVARVNKAENMAQMLYDQGITAGKAAKWKLARWKAEGDAVGVPIGSLETAAEIVSQIGRMSAK